MTDPCRTQADVDFGSLDRYIRYAVKVLRDAGIATSESCESGPGHSFPEPTVRFRGDRAEGFKALAAAMDHGLPIFSLRRTWHMEEGELHGPVWDMTFWPMSKLRAVQEAAEKAGLMEVASDL